MSAPSRPAPMLVAGWLLVAVFGLLVWFVAGDAGAVILLVPAVAMTAWIVLRPGTVAYVVSLVLGGLLVAQQVGFLIAGLTDGGPIDVGIGLSDVEGLIAGLLVVAGAVLALRGRRQPGLTGGPAAGPAGAVARQ